MKMSLSPSRGFFSGLDGSADPAGRLDCPSPEILLRCHRTELPRRKRREVLDHVSRCARCVQDSRFILNVLDEEKQLFGRLEDSVHQGTRRFHQPHPLKDLFARLLSPQAAVALTVVIVSALSYLLVFKPDGRPTSVRGDASGIDLITPLDEPSVSRSLVFKWNQVPDSQSYLVEVFDVSLVLLWRSASIEAAELSPPAELLGKLGRGQSYFWMVTGVFRDGKKVTSRLQEFSLK